MLQDRLKAVRPLYREADLGQCHCARTANAQILHDDHYQARALSRCMLGASRLAEAIIGRRFTAELALTFQMHAKKARTFRIRLETRLNSGDLEEDILK